MIRLFCTEDIDAVTDLWNRRAVPDGFVGHTPGSFSALFLQNRYFSCRHAFVLEENGALGFICGCTGDDLPMGEERGYFTCLVLDEKVDTLEHTAVLLSYLEDSFRSEGKTTSEVLFFNPIHLPWYIPNTNGRQHNNAPGVPIDTALYGRLLSCGYAEHGRECAMYLDLSTFSVPDRIAEKSRDLLDRGCRIALYDKNRCSGLSEMLARLNNPVWVREIKDSAEKGIPFLVAEINGLAVGFAGPVYPEKTGRGYFAGIGVVPEWEGHGFGTQLFYCLCELEKNKGAEYMSLFTGESNPARRIYEGAGFKPARSFAVMRKALKGAINIE